MRPFRVVGLTLLVLVLASPITLSPARDAGATLTSSTCHAPRVLGLTVAAARARSRSSGCHVRFVGAAIRMTRVQTIRSQSARPGQVTTLLTLRVNPLCPGSAFLGPPPGEPLLSPGPTELDVGLFIEGGAFIYRSAPVCRNLVGTSSAGSITVTNAGGVAIANKVALVAGQLLKITLDAGTYTLTGVFAGGNLVGPLKVVVPSGDVVRQDLVLNVP